VPERVNVFTQVGALIAACLAAWEPLAGFTVVHGASGEEASARADGDTIRVDFLGDDPQVAFGQGETDHRAVYDVTVVCRSNQSGTLSQDAGDAIAEIVAAIAQDRSLGGRVGDVQEIDLGAAEPNGVDANGISIRFRAEFTTSRADWFTLVTSP
jgi:hypothetical protein